MARKGITARLRAANKRRADQVYKASSEAVIERDGGLCRVCGRPASEVHHLRPRSLGVNHDPSNLVCLCAWCHRDVHAKKLVLSGDSNSSMQIERK